MLHVCCSSCARLPSESSQPLLHAMEFVSRALLFAVCLCVLLQVLLVEQVAHIPAALAQLRSSMQDPVVAIDLEWRPEFGRGFTPVAMVQLSSSK